MDSTLRSHLKQLQRNSDYNKEPVYYCTKCLSLRIRDVEGMDDATYCDKCCATDVAQCTIEEWDSLYKAKYGHSYLENF